MKGNLKYEFYCINTLLATIIGIFFLLVNFSVWCAVGSPMFTIRFLSSGLPMLPLWLYGLFDFLSFGALGFSLGADLFSRCSVNEVARYRGAFFFVLSLVLSFLHHLFFFTMTSFFVSFLIGVISVALLVLAIIDFSHVSRIAFVFAIIGTLWKLYVCLLSIAAFFIA